MNASPGLIKKVTLLFFIKSVKKIKKKTKHTAIEILMPFLLFESYLKCKSIEVRRNEISLGDFLKTRKCV